MGELSGDERQPGLLWVIILGTEGRVVRTKLSVPAGFMAWTITIAPDLHGFVEPTREVWVLFGVGTPDRVEFSPNKDFPGMDTHGTGGKGVRKTNVDERLPITVETAEARR